MAIEYTDSGWFVSDICDYLRDQLGAHWNTERATLIAQWGDDNYPAQLTVTNVQSGPLFAPGLDPFIEIYYENLVEIRHYVSTMFDAIWDIRVNVWFHPTLGVDDVNTLASRYGVLAYRTLRRHYNDTAGRVVSLKLQDFEAAGRMSGESREIDEIAAALTLRVGGRHNNHTP